MSNNMSYILRNKQVLSYIFKSFEIRHNNFFNQMLYIFRRR